MSKLNIVGRCKPVTTCYL